MTVRAFRELPAVEGCGDGTGTTDNWVLIENDHAAGATEFVDVGNKEIG
jgi:hypothetical protein